MNKKRPKKNFIIFFLLVFLICANFSCNVSNDNKSLHIIHMGKDVTNDLLNFNPSKLDDDEIKYVTIEEGTNKNVLAITKFSVECVESNCPDKICVHKCKITTDYDNDMIVCMPHGLIIYYN